MVAGSSSVPPEQGTRSHLQLWGARAATPQLLPDGGAELDEAVNNDLLFPDPFKHFAISFQLSHSSARGQKPLEQMHALGSISVCSQSTARWQSKPHSSPMEAFRFCPSDLLQKRSVPLAALPKEDIQILNSSLQKHAGSASKQRLLNTCCLQFS